MAAKSNVKDNLEVKQLVEANFLFTENLHKTLKLQSEHQGNLVYSPFSLSVAVAMTKIGARGQTADEIATGFHFPSDNKTLANGYAQVLGALQEKSDGYVLASANRIYSMTGFPLNVEFVNTLKNSFYSEAQQLNFSNNKESAATINEWVMKTTNDKIKDLIPATSLNDNTKIVLVNGIYFKGQWAKKFDQTLTSKASFYLSETETVQVDMMRLEEKIPYMEIKELDAQAVALPYQGDRLCMLLVIPKGKHGLNKIEAGLKNLNPGAIFGKMMFSQTKINLSMPKFKVESTLDLVDTLKKMNMKLMFSDSTADFTGIHPTAPLYVSQIIQKAFIEVNEEGSEATAATAVLMMARSLPMIIDVNANRPFLFQIINRQTNFVLFSGTCNNPLKN